jgi:hypothetical protein
MNIRTLLPPRRPVSFFLAFALLLVMSGGLSGCGRDSGSAGMKNATRSADGRPTHIKCGDTTYRLSPEKIDGAINEGCERTTKSYELMMSSRSARSRFTCQDSKGHVVMSMLVRDDLLDVYNRSCQQFGAAEAALPNSPTDRQPYFAVLKQFQAETNQLTRQSVDAANVIWRQNRSDKAALNQLVKARGGSIEIAADTQVGTEADEKQ